MKCLNDIQYPNLGLGRSFVVAIDEIERQTGIDFFPQLEDVVENQIEGVVNYVGWNL